MIGEVQPTVGVELALHHGLDEHEYERVCQILGRVPSYEELGMYSVMWSEHCSYKNSIAELRKLPREGNRLLVRAGEENAGIIDIGEGYGVAFKIESHNHPSAVEPYQGAATGVGGIMRDIFTMGARPIAALNSLRFGNLDSPRTKYSLKNVVKGIGDYGNSFGVPTIAGEVYFDDSYNDNPLVNAMSVGIVQHGRIARASATGPGNLVLIVGSATGKDGIHGATFASEEISEESESKRPSVQVGDPFTEKLLLEATLEVIRAGYVVGIQDMGAAGITCSLSEMSARGKTGVVVDLDRVPVREQDMTAYEILLSESQERMLLVVKPENLTGVKGVFGRWDLQCEVFGEVSGDGRVKVRHRGRQVADVPSGSLVLGGGAPEYHRDARIPYYIGEIRSTNLEIPKPSNYGDELLRLLGSPNICSRNWVSTQYDSSVRTNTLAHIAGDAAMIRIKGTTKALAMKTDCNPRYVYLNPYVGSQIAVAESARNVVATGATPLAITNCLNFGNPYDEEVFWQFKESIRGISDACSALDTPVTGGNVSFYNEGPRGAIYPTPVIGMLGLIEDYSKAVSAGFKHAGDLILLLGVTRGHIGGSEYLKMHGKTGGDAPPLDLFLEKSLHKAVLEMVDNRLIHSAHDLSDGGLAVALAEASILAYDAGNDGGIEVAVDTGEVRPDSYLFGEDQSRMLVSCSPGVLPGLEGILERNRVPYSVIGTVRQEGFRISGLIALEVPMIAEVYNGSLARRLE